MFLVLLIIDAIIMMKHRQIMIFMKHNQTNHLQITIIINIGQLVLKVIIIIEYQDQNQETHKDLNQLNHRKHC